MTAQPELSANRCPCGAELTSSGALAHGVCDYCRVDAKKSVRRTVEPAPTEAMFDVQPQPRRLVPLDGWPDRA